jgi:hypothetical protein
MMLTCALLVVMSVLVPAAHSSNCMSTSASANMGIVGYSLSLYSGKTLQMCKDLCCANPACLSINYDGLNAKCTLTSKKAVQVPNKFQSVGQYKSYYERKDNDGSCMNAAGEMPNKALIGAVDTALTGFAKDMCIQACCEVTTCKSINWRSSDGRCELNSEDRFTLPGTFYPYTGFTYVELVQPPTPEPTLEPTLQPTLEPTPVPTQDPAVAAFCDSIASLCTALDAECTTLRNGNHIPVGDCDASVVACGDVEQDCRTKATQCVLE